MADDRTQSILDILRGTGEATATLLSGAAAQPVAGLTGVSQGLTSLLRGRGWDRSVADAVDQIDRTQDALTYTPGSKAGQRSLAATGHLMEPVAKAIDYIPSKVGEISPTTGAILAGAGAVVDPTKILGKAGKVAKIAARAGKVGEEAGAATRAAEAAGKAAEAVNVPPAAHGFEPTTLTPEMEQRIPQVMADKAAREAVEARKVMQAQEDAAALAEVEPGPKVKKPKEPVDRSAKPADVYRQMYASEGMPAVLREGRANAHLKPSPSGEGFVGAPRTIKDMQGIEDLRGSLDKQFADAADLIGAVDPEGRGTWYDRAKQSMVMSTEPHQLRSALGEHSVYSAGASPEAESVFTYKHGGSRAAGEPVKAGRPGPMANLDLAAFEAREPQLGDKTGEYFVKLDPRTKDAGPFGVNDFRAAQGFGYTDTAGRPWKAGVSKTMHPVMDMETALGVARANERAVGGKTDWTGPQYQEVPWILGKAQDFYSRTPEAKLPDLPEHQAVKLQRMAAELRKAGNTQQDYFYKHAFSGTGEPIPGASTGHVPEMLNQPMDVQRAYEKQGTWDRPSPMSDMPEHNVPQAEGGLGNYAGDKKPRDVIYSSLGFRQLPVAESSGAYINMAGKPEANAMTMRRPLVAMEQGGQRIDPGVLKALDAVEHFRGVMDAQEAYAGNLPNTGGAVKGKGGLVLDTRRPLTQRISDIDPALGKQVDPETLAEINRLAGLHGFGAGATSRGVSIFPYDPASGPKELSAMLRSGQGGKLKAGQHGPVGIPLEERLQQMVPEARQMPSDTTSIFGPAIGKWSAGPGSDIIPTRPFSGEATSQLLEKMASVNPKVARDISESEWVRESTRGKLLRDEEFASKRRDIQNMRHFFSEADWPKAVEMIRRGVKPAAALAALGYSLESMAGQEAPPPAGR